MDDALIDRYLAGPETLRKAVAGLTRAQLLARPVPGKWSAQEVVCHLADFEPVYADRIKRVITQDRPILFSAHEVDYAALLAYHDRDAAEELDLIDATRKQLARILKTLPDSTFDRVGIYKNGDAEDPRTLTAWLTYITNHIEHHVPFIVAKRKALGLDAG